MTDAVERFLNTNWMERASQSRIPEMKSLAAEIDRDRAAVIAALAYEWSNGTTEGHVLRQ